MEEKKIIFSKRFKKDTPEEYEAYLETDEIITSKYSNADDFLNFIKKSQVRSE